MTIYFSLGKVEKRCPFIRIHLFLFLDFFLGSKGEMKDMENTLKLGLREIFIEASQQYVYLCNDLL
jgi:hypothetical protein